MTGTKVDALSFSVVTDSGFNAAPDGVTSEFYIDDGSNRVAVIGKVTSSLFQIERYVDGYTSVTWGNTVSIVGTLSAETMNRKIHGVAGIALGGQSQIVGYNEGKDSDIEYPRAGVTEYFANQDYRTLASEPLDHLDALGTTVRSVTFALHYAETLQREGFNRIEFIAGGTGITSFSEGHWVRGGTQYDNFLAKIKGFILDDSANFLNEIVMAIGESDAVNNQTKAQMDAHLLTFCTHIRADIFAETGVNVDRVPIIFLGMNSFFIGQGTGAQVESSLADAPNLIPFVGYVETSSYATTTTTLSSGVANHHSAETHRRIGTRELIEGRRMALKNLAEALPANIALSVGAATEIDSAQNATANISSSATFGPFVLNDANPSQDTQNGVITTQSFDNLNLMFTFNGDTNWAQYWCYLPNDYQNNSAALLRLRLQPGDGNLNVIMSERNAAQAFVDVFTGSIPYTLSTDLPLRITRNASGLVRLLSGETLIGSGTHPNPIAVVEGLIHFGNTTAGSEVVFKDIQLAPGGISISSGTASETDTAQPATASIQTSVPESVFLVQKGQEQTLTGNKVTGWGNTKNAEVLNNNAGLLEPTADASGNVTFQTDRILFHADGPSYINNTAITLIFDITKLTNTEGKIYGTHAGGASDIRTQASVKLQGTTLNYSGLVFNNRTHLAVTLDRSGNSIKAFLDGVENASGTLSAYQAESAGATEMSLGNGMHAVVHNFAIYNAVLTGAECEAAAARDFV